MKVVIRYPKRREVEVNGRRKLREILKELNLNPETVIAVQGSILLTSDAFLKDEDTIEVISAISGGT